VDWFELTFEDRRLKDNFSVIKEEDRPRLLAAKEEVERDMNEQKWQLIADKVQVDGGGEYSVSCAVIFPFSEEMLTILGRSPPASVQEAHGQGRTSSAAGHRRP
jgi:hypothetical protein